jgi:glycosyltransferase involved in cell wall biosynthesis
MIGPLAYLCLGLVGATLALVIWNVTAWPRVRRSTRSAPVVSVLIPARNEALNIAACLDAALAGGSSIIEVIVYDDRSADATADIVRAYTRGDARLRLVTGDEPPRGWCGKNHACARLAAEARGEWLLFLDADARLHPGAADRVLAEAVAREATMVSAWPGLELGSFWERALMPMLNVVTFSLFPAPLSFRRSDPSLGLVHGACVLAERAAYDRMGGHTAVKGEIFEDQRLAQLWRSRGERNVCLDGQNTVTVRMYRGFTEIWRGFQKNFYPAFRHEASFWGFLLLHAAIFVLPFVLALAAPSAVTVSAAAGTLAVRVLLAWRFRHPLWSVLLHPVADAVLFAIAFASWWRCRSGQGVEWKGRRYLAALK